jgi:heterotetrameric sarcosine oxidase gamma subunit
LEARFDLRAGWLIPEVYTAPEAEAAALRGGLGLVDISARGKLALRGVLAKAVMAARWGDVPAEPGDVFAVAERGTLIAALAPDEFLILSPPGDEAEIAASLEAEIKSQEAFLTLSDQSAGLVGLALHGPLSTAVLGKLWALPLHAEAFPNLHAAQSSLAKTGAIIIRRDQEGWPAYELYADRSYGGYLWDALLDAGREFDMQPVGWEAAYGGA